MAVLHIEHAISDYATWKTAFDGFADARQRAGVRGHQIRRPVDNDRFVVIDLDFDTREGAERFLTFLTEQVWAAPDAAPALRGTPQARVLELA